nr:hypothetical protein [Mycoplasmopsis bovis]
MKKFGYHGLSHDYITGRMKQILGKDKINIVVAHLGSGSSLCAIKDGKSFDISVGFSSTDGLMMGTRIRCNRSWNSWLFSKNRT